MAEITLDSFKKTLNALLKSNPHARSKGDEFKKWCKDNFNLGARISHIREQRQTTNRVSEQFRYFDPVVIFVCDAEVKRDGVVKYVLERTYKQLQAIAIIGVTEDGGSYEYTYELLLKFKESNFSKWAEGFFDKTETPTPIESDSAHSMLSDIDVLQQIIYGAPGTGKSHAIKSETKGKDVIRTTFHPDSDYSTFVGAYKPTTKEVPVYSTFGDKVVAAKDAEGKPIVEDKIVYEFVEQAFLQAYINAWGKYAEVTENETPKEQYLIIEEINRGNCAQIFGDLFQLLDRNDAGFSDYPIKADNDMSKHIKKAFGGLDVKAKKMINDLYSEEYEDVVAEVLAGRLLLLPNNLYIWATMNTSDQSLFPIDSAFKRRWEWKYIPIRKGVDDKGNPLGWRIVLKDKEYDWWTFLESINGVIGDTTSSEDKKLGYFFVKANASGEISADKFVGKVAFYLWNDVFKDYGFDNEIFKNGDSSTISFQDFFLEDGKANETVVGKFLANVEQLSKDSEDDGNKSEGDTDSENK